MKGVLSIAHSSYRYVYQGVHMNLSSSFDEPWGNDERRDSKLVFIGKNLDKDAIVTKFRECVLRSQKVAEKRQKFQEMLSGLRFKVGTQVECRVGEDEWSKGEVVALLCREEGIESALGRGIAPYQIKLPCGSFIYAPIDDDVFIRQAKRAV